GDLAGALRRFARQPLEQLSGCEQNAFVVAAPFAFAAVEGRALLDRDEGVLQLCATCVVRMHIAGRDGRDAKQLGEIGERGVAPSSVTCAPPARVTSAPVIGRTPRGFAACANSSEP